MFTVIERLLQLSIVKYSESAFGTSRSWPRVASPCGGSNLMTSAPIQASSCEHVGPACTWVMSRMRTSFNASMLFSNDPTNYFFLALGFRLVMRPLSVPAVSSITALISVGLRDLIASSMPLRSSAGVVACTPTPPNASMILS